MAHPIRSWWKHFTQIHGTVDFADQEATSVLDIEELFKSILTGAMFLGVAFCLWQDAQDDFEWSRVLNIYKPAIL